MFLNVNIILIILSCQCFMIYTLQFNVANSLSDTPSQSGKLLFINIIVIKNTYFSQFSKEVYTFVLHPENPLPYWVN